MSLRSGLPPRLVRRLWTSAEFTELKAYRARNTLNPDVWFSMAQMARYLLGTPLASFVPVDGFDESEAVRRQAEAADRDMDRRT